MKEYELTVLIHPDLEMNLDPALDKIKSIIAAGEGEIVKEDSWGKKRLAYTINGQEFAVYQYFELKLPASAPLKISNSLNITDEVLRYLLVTKDEKLAKAQAEKASKESEAEETSSASDKGE